MLKTISDLYFRANNLILDKLLDLRVQKYMFVSIQRLVFKI